MRHFRSQPKTTFRLGDILLDQFSFRGGKSVTVTMPDGSTHMDKAIVIRPQSLKGRAKVAIRSHNYALVQEKRYNAKLLKSMASSAYNKLAKVGWWQRETRELKRLLEPNDYKSIDEITDPKEKKLFQVVAGEAAQSWKQNHKLLPLFNQYNDYLGSASKLEGEAKLLMNNLGSANPLKTTLVVKR